MRIVVMLPEEQDPHRQLFGVRGGIMEGMMAGERIMWFTYESAEVIVKELQEYLEKQRDFDTRFLHH